MIRAVSFSGINGRKDIRIIPASKPADFEKSIENRLGIASSPVEIKKFKNGETYVNIKDDMRNKDVYIMPSVGTAINDNLMETYLKADAAKRMGAAKVIAVLPNFPYARQERKTEPGEPVSARLNLSLLHEAGVDEVITADIHADAMQGFTKKMQFSNLTSLQGMTDYFKNKIEPEDTVVVSPDLGGVKRADGLAKALGTDKAVIYKKRTAHNQAEAEQLLGNVRGKNCIIYDDIIDTAGTITEAAKMLKKNGAEKIYIAASHGLFNGNALERIENAPVEEVVVTNSEKKPDCGKIKQIDIAPVIASKMLDISC